jgi:hypothetical protein
MRQTTLLDACVSAIEDGISAGQAWRRIRDSNS